MTELNGVPNDGHSEGTYHDRFVTVMRKRRTEQARKWGGGGLWISAERIAGSQIEVEAGGVEEGATKVQTHEVMRSTRFLKVEARTL